jgi:hypothetical protein
MFVSKTKVKLKDLIPSSNIYWNEKQLNMVDDISNNFNEKISKIWISKKNEVIDGNHRYVILLKRFGGDYEINVIRFNLTRRLYNSICLLILPISLTVILPFYLLNEKYKKKKWGKR